MREAIYLAVAEMQEALKALPSITDPGKILIYQGQYMGAYKIMGEAINKSKIDKEAAKNLVLEVLADYQTRTNQGYVDNLIK